MSLIETDNELNYAHFVLMIPIVKLDNTVDIFKTQQVGINVARSEKCIYHKIPQYIYRINVEFLDVTLKGCRVHNNLCMSSRKFLKRNSMHSRKRYTL